MKKVELTGHEVLGIFDILNKYKREFAERKDCQNFLYALSKNSRIFEQEVAKIRKAYNLAYWEKVKQMGLHQEFDGHLYDKKFGKEFDNLTENIEDLYKEYESSLLPVRKGKPKKEDALVEKMEFDDFFKMKQEEIQERLKAEYPTEYNFSKELAKSFEETLKEKREVSVHSIVNEEYLPTGLNLSDIEMLDIIIEI